MITEKDRLREMSLHVWLEADKERRAAPMQEQFPADGIGLKIQLEVLPLSGFDGHILLCPIEAETPLPLAPEPEDDEQEN